MTEDETKAKRKGRGFASMSAERRREISRMGGKSVPKEKRSFAQNRDLAAAAGRKGGQGVPDEKRSFKQNRELAVEAGRKGGRSVSKSKAAAAASPASSSDENAEVTGEAQDALREGGQGSNAHGRNSTAGLG